MVPMPLSPLEENYFEEHGEQVYFFCEKDMNSSACHASRALPTRPTMWAS